MLDKHGPDREIRWKQRFENLEKAFKLLQEAAEAEELSRLEEEGLIQRSEYTFELCWKTIKDYLQAEGVEVTYPREVLKSAFQYELVTQGERWLDMLDRRNKLAHTYNEAAFTESVTAVRREFYPAMVELVSTLRGRL